MKRLTSIKDLFALKEQARNAAKRHRMCISICDTGCRALGSSSVRKALEDEIERRGLTDKVRVQPTGCHGFCERGPVLVIRPKGVFYQRVTPEDVPDIIEKTILNDICYDHSSRTGTSGRYVHCHFYACQRKK